MAAAAMYEIMTIRNQIGHHQKLFILILEDWLQLLLSHYPHRFVEDSHFSSFAGIGLHMNALEQSYMIFLQFIS
jgi:hypothetical protein